MEIVIKDKENNVIFSSGENSEVGYLQINMDINDVLKVHTNVESKLFNNVNYASIWSIK